MDHIVIEGFMGTGKGAAAKKLAKDLGLPLFDVDKKITTRMKMTSAEIYDHYGEVYYRAMETFVLAELTEIEERHVIIAGSGLAIMPQNARYLKKLGKVFWLKSPKEDIVARLQKNKRKDWAGGENLSEKVAELLKEREPAYKKTADYVIEIHGKDTATVVAEIASILSGEKEEEEKAAEKEKKPAKKTRKKASD